MSDTPAEMKIVVRKDSSLLVTGGVPLAIQTIVPNKDGLSWQWQEGKKFPDKPKYSLCRCGHSKTKPYCDTSHKEIGFDGTETADRAPVAERSEVIDGPTLALEDDESLCAFARFCDPGGKVWSLVEGSNDPEMRKLAIREAMHCPAGRLVIIDKETDTALEPDLPPSIGVVEDPVLGASGPLWVRGGIPIESHDGTKYEVRNRVTLCRCGASSNKPFCDGSHASIKFQDGIASDS
jgi:CDGSH-type Zn-finger protein